MILTYSKRFLVFVSSLLVASCAATSYVSVDKLAASNLFSLESTDSPLIMDAFAMPENAQPATHHFEGRLIIKGDSGEQVFHSVKDTFKVASVHGKRVKQLPDFDVDLVQFSQYLIPVQRGVVINHHPRWETILEPGRVWQDANDGDYSRASIPFSLRERNANCTHNGAMTFLFRSDGSISNVVYQIASETCLYLKFDLYGVATAQYIPETITTADDTISNYQDEVANRLPVKPIGQLSADYPGVDMSMFGGEGVIDPQNMTVFGFVIDGVNYVGGCETRYGSYPFCEVLDLPSYSLAKSIFAGMGLMHLEKSFPMVKQEKIADYVPMCRISGNWKDVTFENALDMATGNYRSEKGEGDESSQAMHNLFFLPETHTEKLNFSCNAMLRKSNPGSRWIYHTSDTYILGTAMTNFLKNNKSKEADSFNDGFQQIWKSLNLSPVTKTTLRSYDSRLQPATGYGLTLHHDDIARIAMELTKKDGGMDGVVNNVMLNAAMQRVPEDRGLVALDNPLYRYNNGFWAYNIAEKIGCDKEVWLPFMSGYGGISVVMMPNDTVYYHFSDGGKFAWADAAKASNSIRPYCQ